MRAPLGSDGRRPSLGLGEGTCLPSSRSSLPVALLFLPRAAPLPSSSRACVALSYQNLSHRCSLCHPPPCSPPPLATAPLPVVLAPSSPSPHPLDAAARGARARAGGRRRSLPTRPCWRSVRSRRDPRRMARGKASGAACSGSSWRLRGGGIWGWATVRGQGRRSTSSWSQSLAWPPLTRSSPPQRANKMAHASSTKNIISCKIKRHRGCRRRGAGRGHGVPRLFRLLLLCSWHPGEARLLLLLLPCMDQYSRRFHRGPVYPGRPRFDNKLDTLTVLSKISIQN